MTTYLEAFKDTWGGVGRRKMTSPTFNCSFIKKKFCNSFRKGSPVRNSVVPPNGTFFRAIHLGRVVVPSPKIVMNLPRTYEKLHCKGEPFWSRDQRNHLVQTTDTHTDTDPATFIQGLWSFRTFNELIYFCSD